MRPQKRSCKIQGRVFTEGLHVDYEGIEVVHLPEAAVRDEHHLALSRPRPAGMAAMTLPQLKERQRKGYRPIHEVLQGTCYAVTVDGSGKNKDVCLAHFGKKHVHVILLNTFPGRLHPAAETAQAGIYIELSRVKQFDLCSILSQSF